MEISAAKFKKKSGHFYEQTLVILYGNSSEQHFRRFIYLFHFGFFFRNSCRPHSFTRNPCMDYARDSIRYSTWDFTRYFPNDFSIDSLKNLSTDFSRKSYRNSSRLSHSFFFGSTVRFFLKESS